MMNQYSYPSICIPRVFPNIKEPRIRKIFEDLNMAEIACIDIIEKTTEKGEKFNRVFIHFNQWYSNREAVIARERLTEGKEVRIIYDDPWFWKVTAYKQIVVEKKKPVQKKACFQFDEGLKLRDFAPLQTERYRYNDVRRNQYDGPQQRCFQQEEDQRRSKLLQEQQMRQQLLQRRQQRQEEQQRQEQQRQEQQRQEEQRQEEQRQPVTDFVPRSVAVKKPKKNKYNDIDNLTTKQDSTVNYGNLPYPQKKKKGLKAKAKAKDQDQDQD
jgi:hypothetical protein